jgi:hypothetical protein
MLEPCRFLLELLPATLGFLILVSIHRLLGSGACAQPLRKAEM